MTSLLNSLSSTEPAAAYQGLVETVISSRSIPESSIKSSVPIKPKKISSDSSLEDEYADSEEVISDHCESEWRDDYNMRAFCEDQQRAAVENLRHQSHDDIPAEIFQHIRLKAAQEWPEDFQMRLFTENQQLEAYRKLHRAK